MKKTNKLIGDLESTLNMSVVEIMLKIDKEYYHCCQDGIIYLDKERTIPLINLLDLTGRPQIPQELNPYFITSGYCLNCELEVFM